MTKIIIFKNSKVYKQLILVHLFFLNTGFLLILQNANLFLELAVEVQKANNYVIKLV